MQVYRLAFRCILADQPTVVEYSFDSDGSIFRKVGEAHWTAWKKVKADADIPAVQSRVRDALMENHAKKGDTILEPSVEPVWIPKRIKLTEKTLEAGNVGFCIRCGGRQTGCEPDARNYQCKKKTCGERQVFGAEELLMMGQGYC